jgi:hypothetical protein
MRKHLFLALAALCLGLFLAWWWMGDGRSNAHDASSDSSPSANNATDATTPAIAGEPASAARLIEPDTAIPPPMPPAQIAHVVATNAQPGRMVFVELQFADGRITATRATGAGGRAKPGANQSGVGYLQFEIFSPSGERTFTGSVPDPLHRRLEYEDEQRPGGIRVTVVDHETGSLQLRIPGEANAARLIFFRENAAGREPAGEVILR